VTSSTPLKDLQALRDSLIAERRIYARLSMENLKTVPSEANAFGYDDA
jgi:hypothetical protein